MSNKTDLEIRSGVPVEVRESEDGVRVSGYAAVFNERTDIGGYFTEEVAPGAFTDAVGRDDVVFLINHEGLPLARTRSGTLTLDEDDKGLRMETHLDASDPDAISVIGKMKRGDLDKMSFAFAVERQEWDETGDIPHRIIKRAKLYDVSVVTFPAYDGTDIGLRSLKEHQKSQKTHNFNNARARIRQKQAGSKLAQIEDNLAESKRKVDID